MKLLIVTGTLVGLLALSLTGCNTSSNATTSSTTTSASSSSSSASSSTVPAMSQLEQEVEATEPAQAQETPDSSTITEEPENSPFSSVTPYPMYANTVVAIRLTPEDSAKESQNIQTNEKVTVIEEGSGEKVDWCKVKLESGTESYILKKWLSAEPISIPESNESKTSSTNSGNTNSTPATPTPEPAPEPEPVPEPTPEPETTPDSGYTLTPEILEQAPNAQPGPAPDQDKNGTSRNPADYEYGEWKNSDAYKQWQQDIIDQGGKVWGDSGGVWLPNLA